MLVVVNTLPRWAPGFKSRHLHHFSSTKGAPLPGCRPISHRQRGRPGRDADGAHLLTESSLGRPASLPLPSAIRSLHPEQDTPMTRPLHRIVSLFLATGPAALFGADQAATPSGWHAQSLGQAVAYLALFTAIAISSRSSGSEVAPVWAPPRTPGDRGEDYLVCRI